MRLKLIDPSRYRPDGQVLRANRLLFPSLTLPLLAALTPPDIEVKIELDCFGQVNFDEPVDLVGITAYTSRARRAYDIAAEFRQRGVPVVMGGIHASMVPDEALEHADTVIVGEAEETWPQFLGDFRAGRPQRLYRAERRPSLVGLPVPRFSLLDLSQFWLSQGGSRWNPLPLPLFPVQTARGCPHACDFCSVSVFSGREYRARPVAEVVAEIKALGARSAFLVDDNIFADADRARALCVALMPLRLAWAGQCTIGAARDRELLALARRSGCKALYLGIESVAPASLAAVAKKFNRVEDYAAHLRVFREEGIAVIASMIFGLDGDDAGTLPAAYEFLVRNRVPYTAWNVLTPLPGTKLYDRFQAAGRLKYDRWWLTPAVDTQRERVLAYTGLAMPEADFIRSFYDYYRRFYAWPSVARRVLSPPQQRWLAKLHYNGVMCRQIRRQASILENVT